MNACETNNYMQNPTIDFDKETPLFFSPMGDPLYHLKESMIVRFAGRRGVVSTCNLNGGYREDLRYAFNNSCGRDPDVIAKRSVGMRGKTLTEHYAALAEELGLPLNKTTGMGTAALIENTATSSRQYHGVTVMAVATAGIDVNGGRAGEPAAYNEFTQTDLIKPGTINVFLFIDASLDAGTLTRALVTATEAKTAALQELMANSMYSEDLATGSGTDSLIAICNKESEIVLQNSGKHVLLGEMIGQSVKEAITEALSRQTKMTPTRQASIEWQTKRYGITREAIVSECLRLYPHLKKEVVEAGIGGIDRDNRLVAAVAAIAHLCDQNRWQIISDKSMTCTAKNILHTILSEEGISEEANKKDIVCGQDAPAYRQVLSLCLHTLARILHNRIIHSSL